MRGIICRVRFLASTTANRAHNGESRAIPASGLGRDTIIVLARWSHRRSRTSQQV